MAIFNQAPKHSSSRKALVASAGLLALLEVIDAFFLEVPAAAIVFAILLIAGVIWLLKSNGRGPVIYTGLLCLIDLLLVLFIFGGAEELSSPSSLGMFINFLAFVIVSLLGTLSAAMALRTSRKAVQADR